MDVGKKIKQLRQQNDLTLDELASRSELSKGFLSQVERDLTSPSIATLSDIVEALGLDLATFFKSDRDEKIVFTEDDYFIDEQDGYDISWIVPNAQKNDMEPIMITLKPQQESQVIKPHEGEEFGYVLKGNLVLVRNDKEYQLHENDTFYISGQYEHYLRNDTNKIVEVMWVCSPPIF